MNTFQLKLIAISSMLIDHIGAILFPEIIIFRIIGRLAFPIFAFLITKGYQKTSGLKKYMGRLMLFALISQIPFQMAFGSGLNIFFTLFIGLYAIYLYDNYNKIYIVILAGVFCEILKTDYGLYGIVLIFLFHYFRNDFKQLVKPVVFINLAIILVSGLPYYNKGIKQLQDILWIIIQSFSIISLVFIKHYNNKKGPGLKYFFYIFYPGHLLILSMIKKYIN